MRHLKSGVWVAVVAVMFAFGCSSSQKETKSATATELESTTAAPDINCDDFMQQLADGCFAVTAFEADNETPLHVFDEAGNDLGEVDQEWAAGYCECYAQLAFQTFGCMQVIEQESLDDESYARLYEPIVASCSFNFELPHDDNFATDTN